MLHLWFVHATLNSFLTRPRRLALVQEFKIGEKLVYPTQGVGEIIGIERKEVSGTARNFYILRILETNMTVLIPTDNSDTVGLRNVVRPEEVKKIFSLLKKKELALIRQTWNRRYREYMDKLKSGSLFDVAEVMRELSLLRGKKDLSYSERRMLETTRSLLVQELAIAKQTKESRIEKELDAIFS
jgi:CarD family transcriptional regulator